MALRNIFKSKKKVEEGSEPTPAFELNLKCYQDGSLYFDTIKEGEYKKYEELSQQEKYNIVELTAQFAQAFANIYMNEYGQQIDPSRPKPKAS